MGFTLTQSEKQKISDRFGHSFLENVQRNLTVYTDKWSLTVTELVDYFSVNCIFFCHTKAYGDAVLKIGKPNPEVQTEFMALTEYDGRRFCKVYQQDIENGVILIERIMPGTRLKDEQSLEKRLAVFTRMYQGLHRESSHPADYPTYVGWVQRITAYMSNRKDYRTLYLYMKEAEALCLRIKETYNRNMLLHGDFHHDNILLSEPWNDTYKIIDPKGVIGDPVFDVARFILNEYEEGAEQEKMREKINDVIDVLADSLSIPVSVLRQCYFIETAMAYCWCVESDEEPNMAAVEMARELASL